MTADTLSTVFVSGIVLASVYALIASGLSLVWTTLGIFNFAHGALMTLAAYVAWTLSEQLQLGLLLLQVRAGSSLCSNGIRK